MMTKQEKDWVRWLLTRTSEALDRCPELKDEKRTVTRWLQELDAPPVPLLRVYRQPTPLKSTHWFRVESSEP